MAALHIIEPTDTVATAMADLSAGQVVVARDARGAEHTVRLLDDIAFGHKAALVDMPAGAPVIKYGLPIGRANQAIAAGQWVHVHNVDSQRGRIAPTAAGPALPVVWSPPAVAPAAPLADAGLQFAGYPRSDGTVGVRNILLVISTVVCANTVAERIAAAVPGAVCLTHSGGCGQLDPQRTWKTLVGLGNHPNAGAALTVGLGCELLEAEEMAAAIRASGRPAEHVIIQDAGGETRCIEQGVAALRRLAAQIAGLERQPCPISSLMLATECGGSDGTSGLISNPLIGLVSDRLVAAGGAVLLGETTELMGAEPYLFRRAASRPVAEEIARIVLAIENEARRVGMDLRAVAPDPGNIAGGLSSIEEKSLGCIHKGGNTVIQSVVEYADRPAGPGLHIMDTAGQDADSLAGLVAGGAQIVIFSTGRGTPLGNPLAPVIKLTANPRTAVTMAEHIDFSAAAALDGSATLDELAGELFALLLRVADGEETCAERLGHRELSIWRSAITI
jgi:altronate dehydratase large subunit